MRTILNNSQFKYGNVRNDLSLGIDYEISHSQRLSAYRKYWAFFKGKHWSYSRTDDQPLEVVNFARRFVEIMGGWLLKKGFTVSIPEDPQTEQTDDAKDRQFISRALNETWLKNGRESWGVEAAQVGGVTGDLFLRPSWEENSELEDPYVRVDILPSHYVFPDFGGPEGVDRKKMTQCTILFPQYTYKTKPNGFKEKDTVQLNGEIWTAEKRLIIEDEKIVDEVDNPYREIPIIHIPNMILGGEFYGISDLVDLIELNKLYNEKMTDISEIIAYHGSPITIVEGQDIKDLERGANLMWGVKKDTKVYNLELSGDLNATKDFMDRIERLMNLMAGVPKEAMGEVHKAANTSAVALALRFLPLTDRRDMKVATYGLGLRRINRLIIKTLVMKDPEFQKQWDQLKAKNPKGNLYRNNINFGEPLPRDELIELEIAKERLALGLSTRSREMQRMGLNEEEIQRILIDSAKEAQEEAYNEFGFESPSNIPPRGAGKDTRVSVNATAKIPTE